MKLWILPIIALLSVAVADATICEVHDDAESGAVTDKWTLLYVTAEYSSSISHGGSRSLYTDDVFLVHQFNDEHNISASVWMYDDGENTNAGMCIGYGACIGIERNNGYYMFGYPPTGGALQATPSIGWHKFQINVSYDAGTYSYEFFVDDVLDTTGSSEEPLGDNGEMQVELYNGVGAQSYFDDFTVTGDADGCPSELSRNPLAIGGTINGPNNTLAADGKVFLQQAIEVQETSDGGIKAFFSKLLDIIVFWR